MRFPPGGNLVLTLPVCYDFSVSLSEILHEIESLPPEERWQVLQYTRQLLEPDIPEEFKEGMEAIRRGETVDLDEAMPELGSD